MERQLDGVDFDLFPYIVQLTLRTVAGILFFSFFKSNPKSLFFATRGCNRTRMIRQKFAMSIIREFPCRVCYEFAYQCPFSLCSSDDFKRSPSEFIVVSKGPWQHQHVSLSICAAVSRKFSMICYCFFLRKLIWRVAEMLFSRIANPLYHSDFVYRLTSK